jgi:hypothetical protein
MDLCDGKINGESETLIDWELVTKYKAEQCQAGQENQGRKTKIFGAAK